MSVNFVPQNPVVVSLAARRAWRAQAGAANDVPPDTVGLEPEYDDEPGTAALEEPTGQEPAWGSNRSPPTTPVVPIGVGTLLRERYQLEHMIGSGGACLVFAASDRHRTSVTGVPGRLAVKLLRPESRTNSACIYRLAREFRQMQRLTHPNVARVFDIDCDGAVWFMTLELLHGDTLRQRIKARVVTEEAFELLRECSAALTHAHSLGITHGDLKPSNIFVTTDGDVRLLDFGSVPDREESAANPDGCHRYAATPAYASPQILLNEIADPRDDVFSLACVAYELLSGEHPFERRSSLEAKRQGLRPAYVRRIQPRHYSVLADALSFDREYRPATTREFLSALMASELAHSQPVRPAPEPTPEKAQPDVSPSDPLTATHTVIDAEFSEIDRVQETAPTAEPRVSATPARSTATARVLVATWPQPAVRPDANAIGRALVPLVEAMKFEGRPMRRARSNPHLTMLLVLFVAAVFTAGVVSRYSTSPADAVEATPAAPPATAPAPTASEPIIEPQRGSPAHAVALAATTKPAAAPVRRAEPHHIVSFESQTIRAAVGQTLAAVTLRRERPLEGRTRVRWHTVDGSAKAGIHYKAIESEIASFADGQQVRSLFIPLLQNSGHPDSRPARSFTIRIEPAEDQAAGAIADAEVVIAAVD